MALTSHYWDLGWPKNPSTPLVEYEYVINPVNMKGNHWGIIIIQLSYVDTPKKLLHAHSFLMGNKDLQIYNVSKNDVKVMRLRMLWVILMHSQERGMSEADTVRASQIQKKLEDELK
ncbi:hypothetical protein DVH05_006869 [Phytophthora capsici]|nr:hypothetical protein DVH05_006869 [Phytophthora capsici]